MACADDRGVRVVGKRAHAPDQFAGLAAASKEGNYQNKWNAVPLEACGGKK